MQVELEVDSEVEVRVEVEVEVETELEREGVLPFHGGVSATPHPLSILTLYLTGEIKKLSV